MSIYDWIDKYDDTPINDRDFVAIVDGFIENVTNGKISFQICLGSLAGFFYNKASPPTSRDEQQFRTRYIFKKLMEIYSARQAQISRLSEFWILIEMITHRYYYMEIADESKLCDIFSTEIKRAPLDVQSNFDAILRDCGTNTRVPIAKAICGWYKAN